MKQSTLKTAAALLTLCFIACATASHAQDRTNSTEKSSTRTTSMSAQASNVTEESTDQSSTKKTSLLNPSDEGVKSPETVFTFTLNPNLADQEQAKTIEKKYVYTSQLKFERGLVVQTETDIATAGGTVKILLASQNDKNKIENSKNASLSIQFEAKKFLLARNISGENENNDKIQSYTPETESVSGMISTPINPGETKTYDNKDGNFRVVVIFPKKDPEENK